MGWADKAHKKHKIDSMIRQAMNTPEYQAAKKKDVEQATLKALCGFCFLGCEYLELKHGYKKNGLANFLDFAKGRMKELGSDETYFSDAKKYYMEELNLDVLGALGYELIKGEEDEKH